MNRLAVLITKHSYRLGTVCCRREHHYPLWSVWQMQMKKGFSDDSKRTPSKRSSHSDQNEAKISNDDEVDDDMNNEKMVYLHVGPAGECWVGSSIFAAKHLQPDYVKSIPLPQQQQQQQAGNNSDTDDHFSLQEALVEEIENNPHLGQEIYDKEVIPLQVLDRLRRDDEK